MMFQVLKHSQLKQFFLILFNVYIALAIYCRSPAAFRAVQSLSILSLPCENTLKKIIKSGSEKPGIDLDYLQSQQGKFKVYADNYTNDGFLSPLQLGVLIFDEVKVDLHIKSLSYISMQDFLRTREKC